MEIRNEMGVIVAFTQLAKEAGFEIVSIQADYPDAIIRRDGQEYRTEFEFKARNFIGHKHDPRQCDLIICWENDFPESVLPVISLSKDGWQNTPLVMPSEIERELAYWKYRAMIAEARLRQMQRQIVSEERISSGQYDCPNCSQSFGTVQALNAHSRFCKLIISPEEIEGTIGHNGHRKGQG